MITHCPVIITARDQAWTNGVGMLYEPFEEDETYDVYSVLHIAARTNIPHGKTGYYLLTSTTVQVAKQGGLILIDADGDQYGFEYPQAGPYSSLGEAISGIQPAPLVEGITYPALSTPEQAPLALDELLERKARTKRPLRYCLIGSTDKAQQAFEDKCLRLTLVGQIVLTIGANAKIATWALVGSKKTGLTCSTSSRLTRRI
jgi:hypothetical protein